MEHSRGLGSGRRGAETKARALPNRMLALLLSAPPFSRILQEDVDLTIVDLCRDFCGDLAAG